MTISNAGRTPSHGTPSRAAVFLDNLPYAGTIVLGAALIWLALRPSRWSWMGAAAYLAYGAVGTLWFILFICPHCGRGTSCPSGYGGIAEALRGRRDRALFRRRFARHVWAIVPLWFVPLIVAGHALVRRLDFTPALLAAIFALAGFVVLPLVSRKWICSTCDRRDDCPWTKGDGKRAGGSGDEDGGLSGSSGR